jgi:hypothetical protein
LQIGDQTFAFSTTRVIASNTMTEEELVDFETQMTKAVTDTAGFTTVSVSRVGNDIYVKDTEGRIDPDTALNHTVCVDEPPPLPAAI